MASLLHFLFRIVARMVFFCTMRVQVVRPEMAHAAKSYILVSNHISHFDPVCLGIILRRKIDWMARLEFFRNRITAGLMHAVDAFAVNRQGPAIRGVRTAIRRLQAQRVVGVFPEGEVSRGRESLLHGGALKAGAVLISCRAQAPVLPCLILGTPELSKVDTWLPFRRGKLWVICGDLIHPIRGRTSKKTRKKLTQDLHAAFLRLYAELREKCQIDDAAIP